MWNNEMNINEVVVKLSYMDSACHAISNGMQNVT
jgi:hypothetical protein